MFYLLLALLRISYDIAVQDPITVPMELQFALEANDASINVWDESDARQTQGLLFSCRRRGNAGNARATVEETIDFLLTEKEKQMTDAEKNGLVELLDSLVMAALPKSTKVAKYDGTLYTLKPDEKEGQFCGVFPHNAHVQLSFAKGSELDDPGGLLEGCG
ncbi:hypothetical protein Poly51_58830 [Rubripirellula tenax]|uniref:Uncharacterized protein n=1 Tax=Rubripirellula tenax TaxID=2528015 RepID=A0A5C6EA24_9BACT|nr:hypothetical protein [Rubripirellula tenax]TWU44817.1 hypothetical protein Poly51_58830 [Rubripirellula tenax]